MVNTLRSVIDAARIDAFLTEDRAAERNRSRQNFSEFQSIHPLRFFLNNVSKISLPLEPISNQKVEREKKKEKLQNYSRRQTIETQSSISK